MFNSGGKRFYGVGGWLLLFLLTGCAGVSPPVRYLSSDICLVMPAKTTKQEVVSFLGEPDRKITNSENLEVWIYQKENKTFSKSIPLIGDMLGSHSYEVVTVTFDAELVKTCLYREFDETEYTGLSPE